MSSDFLNLKGYVQISLKDTHGNSLYTYEGNNLVTTAGKNLIASRLKDASSNVPSYIAIGSDNTTPQESDTALLGTEHERVSATVTVSVNLFQLEASFGTGISTDVTAGEFGIFNAATGGTMLARFVIPSVTVASTDTLAVTWKLYIGGAN